MEPEFLVLDAATSEDRKRWIELWRSWPNREPVAHPSYLELLAQPGERVLCAVMADSSGGALHSFILRPLGACEWASGCHWWDATGPLWGYTGVFIWGSAVTIGPHYRRLFKEWAHEHGVVCSFSRLSLFPEEILDMHGNRRLIQPNIVRHLDLTEADLWMDVEHKVRKNVNRAKRDGIVVAIEDGPDAVVSFLDVYTKTMERRDAADDFFFDRGFVDRLVTDLPSSSAIFIARHEDLPVSVELILYSTHHAYSFLGGTLESSFPSRPNDALKYEIFRWARNRGIGDVVLGGGPTPEDGIYRYKKSFAPHGIVPFYAEELVFDQTAYDDLIDMRRAHEESRGRSWFANSTFFPSYRS